jgi:hypothetical protein
VAQTSTCPQGGNSRHRQFIGGRSMNSEFMLACPAKGLVALLAKPILKGIFQFPHGLLSVVWESTNLTAMER